MFFRVVRSAGIAHATGIMPAPKPPPRHGDEMEALEAELLPRDPSTRDASVRDRSTLARLIARLMDTLFRVPGTDIRFGLDPLVGLVPGLGNAVGAIISSLVLVQSVRSGIPRIVLTRMAVNIMINTMGGAVPLVGDLFSVWWKSNVRNYRLYEKHATGAAVSTRSDWVFVVGLLFLILFGLLLILVILIWIALEVFRLMPP